MDENDSLRNVIFSLIEKKIFTNIDLGLPFYIFIMDVNGNEFIPIQYKECSEALSSVKYEKCTTFWKKQIEFARMLDDVVFSKCYGGFGTMLIPIKINNKLVGIIGGCIPKQDIPKRAIEKSIALFKGISRIIELMGNRDFFSNKMINHLSTFIQEVHKGYSIEDPESIFSSPVKTVQKILVEFTALLQNVRTYLFLGTNEKNKFLFITSDTFKVITGSDGINYFLNGIKTGDTIEASNPLFNIFNTGGSLYPIVAQGNNIGYFFIEKNEAVEKTDIIKKYLELLLLTFSSIYSNSLLFDKINKRGKQIYDQEIINFYKLEKLVYYEQFLFQDRIKKNIDNLLGENYTIYIKDNIDERDFVCRLYLSSNENRETYKKIDQLKKNKKYREYNEILFVNSEKELNNKTLDILYDLVFSDVIFENSKNIYHSYIYTILNGMEFKDPFKTGKYNRIISTAELIAGSINLTNEEIEKMRFAIYFMDIGMIGVSDSILESKEKISKSDLNKIKRHSLISKSLLEDFPYFNEEVIKIIESHHENWDGSGSPNGLKGKAIPLLSRIIRIAETYVSLTHNRKFRKAMDKTVALTVIKKESGELFDPELAKKFIELIENES
jgi:response regulator RpfG family c-di-GMP phosphodiesterase